MLDTGYLSQLCFQWCRRTFGNQIADSKSERCLRIAEEVMELCQAEGIPADMMLKLLQEVYSRPEGNPEQEIGGIMVTLMVYCQQQSYDLEYNTKHEVSRILNLDPEHFRKRMAEKEARGVAF